MRRCGVLRVPRLLVHPLGLSLPAMKQAVLYIIAFVLLVIGLSILGRAEAQVGCYQIDRYGFLCIPSTGEIFVQEAHQKLIKDAWVDRTRNKKGERCCDAGKDCHPLNPDEVKATRGGVIILVQGREIFIPGPEIMLSEDGNYWVCFWGERVRCFFAPYSGS
jgi:hypothetical protein